MTPARLRLKARKRDSHKGQNGVVLVIGGSEDYIGAPALVGMSALATLRSGADLVYVAAPSKVAWAINCISPDLITRKVDCANFGPRNVAEVVKLSLKSDVVVIGNGITLTKESIAFMRAIIARVKKPLVIDAAALRVIRLQDVKNAVLLPHRGELIELLSNSKLLERGLQRALGTNVLVKKGHPITEILSRTKRATNASGNAGMTHGGTGDVLAGIVAGLMAQGNDAWIAARIATHVNGKAAERLYRKKGFGYLASDVVKELPFVLKHFQRSE